MAGVIIAGIHSGTGKTTLTMGILRALKSQGIKVGCAKVGPDYIDPIYHSIATHTDCYTLDLWGMRESTVNGILHHLHSTSEMVVIEGVMGLFDGAVEGGGSTADIAHHTGYPIILVVDCAKYASSVSAVIHGFDTLHDDIHIAGIILNKVGSAKHRHIVCTSLQQNIPHIPILGIIHTDTDLGLPSRHLGLVQGCEHDSLDTFLNQCADKIQTHVDIPTLLRISKTTTHQAPKTDFPHIPPLGSHIAITKDEAFQFTYPHIITAWQNAGAKISYFSPLQDEVPHPDADAVYLCGGYPELYLPTLQDAKHFKSALQQAVQNNIPVYGECGGYMVMGKSIIGKDNKGYQMLGILDHTTSFYTPKRTLSYQTASCLEKTVLPLKMRGHAFHYATTQTTNKTPLLHTQDTFQNHTQHQGGVQGSAFGSFFHMIDTL